MQAAKYNVALLWAGDATARRTTKLEETRLSAVADALRQVDITVEPAVYADELVDEVRDQLLRVDGVLVWVDPIVNGRDRSVLDALAASGCGRRHLRQRASRCDSRRWAPRRCSTARGR